MAGPTQSRTYTKESHSKVATKHKAITHIRASVGQNLPSPSCHAWPLLIKLTKSFRPYRPRSWCDPHRGYQLYALPQEGQLVQRCRGSNLAAMVNWCGQEADTHPRGLVPLLYKEECVRPDLCGKPAPSILPLLLTWSA